MPGPHPTPEPLPGTMTGQPPSLALDFVSTTSLDSRFTFTRGGNASYYDATGTLQQAATNQPRFDYGPHPTGWTNWVRNSTMQGAGSPGTLPTNWSGSLLTANGVNYAVVGTGTDPATGYKYIDFRLYGTPTASSGAWLGFDTSLSIPACVSQTWTTSAYLAVAGGSTTNISVNLRTTSRDTYGGPLADAAVTGVSSSLTSNLQRFTATCTFAAVGVVYALPDIEFDYISGGAFDITLRIAAPQCENAAYASSFIPTTNAAVTEGATSNGLLIEGNVATNTIQNPRAEGAVIGTVGSGGSLPTNWGWSSGFTLSVVGTGTENGIPFIDLRYQTSGAAGSNWITFDGGAPASNGQPWTGSLFLKQVGGSMTNVSAVRFQIEEHSTGLLASTSFTFSPGPASSPLATNRFFGSHTNSNAATTGEVLSFFVDTSGAADVTLRIGVPQLEQNSAPGPSMPILPPAGSPAATTRNADQIAMTATPYLNPNCVTMAVEAVDLPSDVFGNPGGFVQLDDGGSANSFFGVAGAGLGSIDSSVIAGGVGYYGPGLSITGQAQVSYAQSLVGSTLSYSCNGAAAATANTSLAYPTGLTRLQAGYWHSSFVQKYLYLRRLRLWTHVLSSGTLQQLSGASYQDTLLDMTLDGSVNLDPRLTFSRNSVATYTDSNGTLRTAYNNQPRFDHDPITLEPRGVLVEEGRTNLLLYSASLSTPPWGALGCAVTANAAIAPDSTATATNLQGQSGAGRAYQASTVVFSTNTFTGSVWLRADAPTTARIGLGSANIGELVTQSVSVTTAWQRFSVSATGTSADTGNAQFSIYCSDGTNPCTIYAWGAQLEEAGYATSYIPTTSATAGRNNENLQAPTSQWFNAGDGTICVEALWPTGAVSNGGHLVFQLSDGTDNNSVALYNQVGQQVAFIVQRAGGALNLNGNFSVTIVPNQTLKFALSWASGVYSAAAGGTYFGATSAVPVPTITQLNIGNGWDSGSAVDANVRRIRYWPRALTNAELQQVTT